jgi:4-amino-4-deoxy-L-arabinose transferase-like glycosyltransferase
MRQDHIRRFLGLDGLFLGLLITVALWTRWPLLSIGLWRDDAATVLNSQARTIAQMFEQVLLYEHSPPGYFLLMHGWMQWFGTGEFSVKLPGLLIAVILIPATYGLGRVVGSRQVGLMAAAMATISQSAIFYSQELRTYISAALLTCCIMIIYSQLIQRKRWTDRQSLPQTVGLIVILAASLYLHYTGILFIVGWLLAVGILALFNRIERKQFWNLLMAVTIAGIMFLPWLMIVWQHFSGHLPISGGDTWRQGMPWSYRRVVMIRNMVATMRPGFPEVPKLLWIAFGFIAVRSWASQRTVIAISRTRSNPMVLILGLTIAFTAVMEASLGLGSRYIFFLSPLGWVTLSCVLVRLLAYGVAWVRRVRWARHVLIALFLCGTLLLLPGARSFIVGSNHSKSGVRDLIADVRSGEYRQLKEERSFYLMLPDVLGITASYYNPPKTDDHLQIQGFPHWDYPELHNPSTHLSTWRNPEIVNEILQQVEQRHREGYRYLGLVHSPQLAHAFPAQLSNKVDQTLQQLQQRYRVVQTKNYPAAMLRYELAVSEMDEGLIFYILDLAESPSRHTKDSR